MAHHHSSVLRELNVTEIKRVLQADHSKLSISNCYMGIYAARASSDLGRGSHMRGLHQLAMLYTIVRGQSQVVSRELLQPFLRDRVWLRYTW